MCEPSSHSLVRVVKLREAERPLAPAGSWATYVPGGANRESLPIDYEIVGCLLAPIANGGCLHVLRLERNGVGRLGEFRSTRIQSVDTARDTEGALLVVTQNSVYRVIGLGAGMPPAEKY